jgi:hypothetical protein
MPPCSLVVVSEVRAASVIRAVTMEAVRTSETSVCFDETTLRYPPEDCHLLSCCCENLKSHIK